MEYGPWKQYFQHNAFCNYNCVLVQLQFWSRLREVYFMFLLFFSHWRLDIIRAIFSLDTTVLNNDTVLHLSKSEVLQPVNSSSCAVCHNFFGLDNQMQESVVYVCH